MKYDKDRGQVDEEGANALPMSRDYQIELLKESLKQNIIITLPTGTGKTHVAILRIQHHLQCSQKIAWFLCPTVALCQQQHLVISGVIPKVMMISGSMEPERWSSHSIWQSVADEHNVVVSTPQVLLDALNHSYLKMGVDIGLLIFDEAHHAIADHPYNRIMQEVYHELKHDERPVVLGLTASPVYGTDIQRHLGQLESNLDAIVRLPRMHESELAQFVYKPELRFATYMLPYSPFNKPPDPRNLENLRCLLKDLDVEQDPWVIASRRRLAVIPVNDPQRKQLEQKIAKAVYKRDTYTLRNLKALHRTCEDLYLDVGTWALGRYMQSAIDRVLKTTLSPETVLRHFGDREKDYFLPILKDLEDNMEIVPELGLNESAATPKVRKLIEVLINEKTECEALGTSFVGLLLVTTRACALILKELLTLHPDTAQAFRCGCLVGFSSHARRSTTNIFDISYDSTFIDEYQQTLGRFRLGEINLLIATSVAEEGLDIQACGSVIRFDLSPNLQSWIQSQGRARRQRSTFTLMIQDDMHRGLVDKWEDVRGKIEEMCKIERERLKMLKASEEGDAYDEHGDTEIGDDDAEVIEVDSTGARLSLASAVGHLDFFCAKFPHSPYSTHSPTYEFCPSQKYILFEPTGAFQLEAPQGPFEATVTLPSLVPPHLRTFTTTEKHRSTRQAKRHVALQAYRALYEAGLLSDRLLPFQFPPTTDRESIEDLLKDVEGREGVVSAPKQMNPWMSAQDAQSQKWQGISISIQGVTSLRLHAPTNLLVHLQGASFPIFDTGGIRRKVQITCLGPEVQGSFDKALAEQFTRALVWGKWGSSMKWGDTDFAYLLLPGEDEQSSLAIATLSQQDFYIPGKEFLRKDIEVVYPTIAKRNDGHALIVDGISFDPASEGEIEALLARYPGEDPATFRPPFIKARNITRKANYLSEPPPLGAGQNEQPRDRKPFSYLPSMVEICTIPSQLVHASFLLPSILEQLRHLMIAHAGLNVIRELSPTPTLLTELHFNTVLAAFTSKAARANFDYERLETLGDTVLKIVASVCLLEKHEWWHEDYLSKAKDHIVSNSSLSRAAIRNDLGRFIIRLPFRGRKWTPLLRKMNVREQDGSVDAPEDQDPLSTKMLADVIEALLGACFLSTAQDESSGFRACTEFLECILPQKEMTWLPPAMLAEKIDARRIELFFYPPQLSEVETALGYQFRNKTHLLEALTHSSHQQIGQRWMTYERHEFLGDAVLDMIITKWFHHATASTESDLVGAAPEQLHLCKIATVNGDLLGLLCFELKCLTRTSTVVKGSGKDGRGDSFFTKPIDEGAPLWKYLLHSSSLILDQQNKCALRCMRSRDTILSALESGSVYPWAELRGLLFPKLFSDMVESVLGAIYIDSYGNLDVCWGFLERIGLTKLMKRFVDSFSSSPMKGSTGRIDLRHPTSVWTEWASHRDMAFGYIYATQSDGKMACTLVADQEIMGTAEAYGRGTQVQDSVKLAATEDALSRLNCRE